jgi:signal transduction histidine kinase
MNSGPETKPQRSIREDSAARQRDRAALHSFCRAADGAAAAKHAGVVVLMLDRDYRICAVNAAYSKLFRSRPRTVIGKDFFTIDGGRWDVPEVRRSCARAFAARGMFHDCLVEPEIRPAGPKSFVVSGVAVPKENDSEPRLLLIIAEPGRDRVAVGSDARPAGTAWGFARLSGHPERDLRALNARLIAGQEELCKDVARELHDEFSQQLAAIALDLRAVVARAAPTLGDTRESLEAIAERVRFAADALHLTSRRLHPGILDDLGLVVALKAECHAVATALGIPVRFSCNEMAERLDANVALCLYRVAQEALKNVQRHARARTVRVVLEQRADQLELSIDDDGSGFDLDLLRDQPCVGQTGMAERVGLLGGKFEIRSAPGAGTTVRVWVSLVRRRTDG